jgi:hypothetical protein
VRGEREGRSVRGEREGRSVKGEREGRIDGIQVQKVENRS